ncbi:MAG: GGDEF domain-containing protein [Spirochaetales bacterium]|nr:GGDEF domain-containing protein [Spirochaetales bacterium]
MNLFDLRTIVTGYTISSLVLTVVAIALWKKYHRRFSGLDFCLLYFIMQSSALLLMTFYGIIPDILSITGADALLIVAVIFLYMGLERFIGRPAFQIHNFILLAAFTILHAYFVLTSIDVTIPGILFSATLLIVCLQCAWYISRHGTPKFRTMSIIIGIIFGLFCLISMIRIIGLLVIPGGDLFFNFHNLDKLLLLINQMLFIILTISLLALVNRRVLFELESDIYTCRQGERIISVRLKLWEFSAKSSLNELMQKALDEIEDLTGSKIGFYHFFDETHNNIELQAWSTRTKETFCKAEGEGMHYPLSEAGVWTDCVRERMPVIHNDYDSLPNKKGMPPGHAIVIRELTVPTIRNGQIVSIMGVGNKPADYDANDVEIVAYITDLVWTIIKQKRADEQIHQLNDKLQHQAMTDELTGLSNRRAFFLKGSQEIKRSKRYGNPLTMIMLDIDRFKNINDSYGHEAGDDTLRCIARILMENIREVEMAGRLGGEEFGVLMPDTNAKDALPLAERLRVIIEKEGCLIQDQETKITASFGVAAFSKDMKDIDALIRNADAAMYIAKKQGRNRVVFLG